MCVWAGVDGTLDVGNGSFVSSAVGTSDQKEPGKMNDR